MSFLSAFVKIAQGAAETAVTHQFNTDVGLQRKSANKGKKMAENCTPCAAAAYVESLRGWAKGSRG